MQQLKQLIYNQFELKQAGSSIRKECAAGFTTFLTMAYIAVVNPLILSTTGMDLGAVFVATCLVIFIGSMLFGFYVNYPIAIAPAMGLNVYFAYTMVPDLEYSWTLALAAVFLASLLLFVVSLTRFRQYLISAIPEGLQYAIGVGIGLFILVIGLQKAGILMQVAGFKFSEFVLVDVILLVFGLVLIILLKKLRVSAFILLSIFVVSIISLILDPVSINSFVSMPPSITPTFFALNLTDLLRLDMLILVLSLFLIMLFDTTGTLIGIVKEIFPKKQQLSTTFYSRSLKVESLASLSGSLLGTSPTTPYLESLAGIQAGGRTGLTAIIVALLFLALLFLFPIVQVIPAIAIAPVLVFVGLLMTRNAFHIHWRNFTIAIPSLIIIVMIPISFSIADGLGWGIIVYTIMCIITGRWRKCHPMMYSLAVLFSLYFLYGYNFAS